MKVFSIFLHQQLPLLKTIVLIVAWLLASCGRPPEPTYEDKNDGLETPIVVSTPSDDNYKVELGTEEHLELPGPAGELRVWVGSERESAQFPADFASDEVTLSVSGKTATISPFAPDFVITPETSQCIRVHPSGSEVIFQLAPQKSGDFHVGANVNLYDSEDCSGAPIPKSAARLKVTVSVNSEAVVTGGLLQLWAIFWEKLIDFWAAVVALFFALLLFLIRKKVKQWFGFSSEK